VGSVPYWAFADPQKRPIRILVVESEPFLAQVLAALSQEFSDLLLVGAASTAAEALAMAPALEPDVALIDAQLPDGGGIELCDHLHVELPATALIILSEGLPDEGLLLAVESGVSGVLAGTAPAEELVQTILRAAEDEFLLPRSVTIRLFRLERDLRREN
jgi:DNA-binding NarL/FixJ family response regulator